MVQIVCDETIEWNMLFLFSKQSHLNPQTKLFRSYIQVMPAHEDTFSEERKYCCTLILIYTNEKKNKKKNFMSLNSLLFFILILFFLYVS